MPIRMRYEVSFDWRMVASAFFGDLVILEVARRQDVPLVEEALHVVLPAQDALRDLLAREDLLGSK